MQPEIGRSPFTGNLDDQVVCENICLLVSDATGFGGRHIGAVANGINIVPLGFERVVIYPDPVLSVRQAAIEENLCGPVWRHHYEQIIA